MIEVREARLRSNLRYRLVPYDQLQASDRHAFRSLSEDSDFFGVLVPPEGSVWPIKSVSRDAALLFMTLREPACLPHLLDGLFGSHASERLEPLILDGVFEVEQSGSFVTGAAALAQFGDREVATAASRLTQLSTDAVAYAAALEGLSVHDVATRLYLFNAAPVTLPLRRRFADDARLLSFVADGDDVGRRLRSRWHCDTLGDSWIAWQSAALEEAPGYKLYISPVLDHLPRVFQAAVEAFARVQCTRFKLGRGAYGVLRPDKLVAYFSGLDALLKVAELIRLAVPGEHTQGVPFTAPIDPGGLLSWGMDPPRFEQVLAWQQIQSWRQWLTGRIAIYTLAAKQAGADAHSFVRQRIQMDGVDPQTWNPDLAIWRGPVGTEQETL